MKYFFISQDKRYTDAPNIINWFGKIDKKDICIGRAKNIPAVSVFDISLSEHVDFIDVLSSPFFLISEKLVDIFKVYDPSIITKQIALIDDYSATAGIYHMPILEKIDCFTDESTYNLDKSVVRRAVLDPAKTKDKAVFWLAGVRNTYTIIRLDLVESVLRRAGRGIALQELELKAQGDNHLLTREAFL